MNNIFSLQRTSQTGNLDSNLILRQYKLDLKARFRQIKSINPKLGQSQIGKELGHSSYTLQRHRNDLKMLSPYRTPPANTKKRRQKIPNTNLDDNSNFQHDVKRPQMTSNDLNKT